MKKNINITDILINGSFDLGLKAGLTKLDVEKILSKPLGAPDIDTPDVDYYYMDMKTGVCLVMIFDKAGICYAMKIKLADNEKFRISFLAIKFLSSKPSRKEKSRIRFCQGFFMSIVG